MMKVALPILFAFLPAPLISQSTEQSVDGGQAYCTYALVGTLASFAKRCHPEDEELIKLLTRINKTVEPRLLNGGLITADEIAKNEAYARAADCASSNLQFIYDQLTPQMETMTKGLKALERDARTPMRTECLP